MRTRFISIDNYYCCCCVDDSVRRRVRYTENKNCFLPRKREIIENPVNILLENFSIEPHYKSVIIVDIIIIFQT